MKGREVYEHYERFIAQKRAEELSKYVKSLEIIKSTYTSCDLGEPQIRTTLIYERDFDIDTAIKEIEAKKNG